MSVRTMNFDAIAAATPLNREASVVRDGSGDLWEAKIAETVPRWAGPPPMKRINAMSQAGRMALAEFVGHRFGRLVVLGILAGGTSKKSKKEATWVCRCDCGYYEGRKARALRREHEHPLACTACTRLMQLQRRAATSNTRARREAEAKRLDELAAGVVEGAR